MARPAQAAADQLSTLRWVIETLQRVNESLFNAQLTKESGDVLDAAVKLAQVYTDLIQLASQSPLTPRKKDPSNGGAEGLPF